MTNKKITIGIYGDSFSDPNWVKNNYKAWPELLETDYTIKNYSLSGTSLWWSYNKFLETCDKIDYAIFVVTIPGRLHIDYQDQHINLNPISWPVWDVLVSVKFISSTFIQINEKLHFIIS
jgi:hypothetical protein